MDAMADNTEQTESDKLSNDQRSSNTVTNNRSIGQSLMLDAGRYDPEMSSCYPDGCTEADCVMRSPSGISDSQ